MCAIVASPARRGQRPLREVRMRPYPLTVARREVAGPVPHRIRDTDHAEVVDEAGAAHVANAARRQAGDRGGVARQLGRRLASARPTTATSGRRSRRRRPACGRARRRRAAPPSPGSAAITSSQLEPLVVDEQVRRGGHRSNPRGPDPNIPPRRSLATATAADGPPQAVVHLDEVREVQHADSRRDRLALERRGLPCRPTVRRAARARSRRRRRARSTAMSAAESQCETNDRSTALVARTSAISASRRNGAEPAPALRIMKASSGRPDGSAL